MKWLTLALLLISASVVQSAEYHISPNEPKAYAALKPKLVFGDTVIFKTGKHRISVDAVDGVTYIGEVGAKIDGSVDLVSWTNCKSEAECFGNPNFASIYYATIPDAETNAFKVNPYQGETALRLAQSPVQPSAMIADNTDHFYRIPAVESTKMTDIGIEDKRLTGFPPNIFDSSYAIVWHKTNRITYRRIRTYDPVAGKIAYDSSGGGFYNDRDVFFSIANVPTQILRPGDYFVDESRKRIYVWPLWDLSMEPVTVTVLSKGFSYANKSQVAVRDLVIQRFWDAPFINPRSTSIVSINLSAENVVVKQNAHMPNTVSNPVRNTSPKAVEIYNTTRLRIDNVVIENNRGGLRGLVLLGVVDGVVSNTIIRGNSGTGGYFSGCQDVVLMNSYIGDSNGKHANGLSIYTGCNGILVLHCVIENQLPVTLEDSQNIKFVYSKLWHDVDRGITGWAGKTPTKDVWVWNCLLSGFYISDGSGEPTGVSLINNLSRGLTTEAGWVIEGNLIIPDLSGDFFPVKTSPTVNVGVELPTSYWKVNDEIYRFDSDLIGNPAPISARDVGPFEYQPALLPTPTPTPPPEPHEVILGEVRELRKDVQSINQSINELKKQEYTITPTRP